MHFDLSPYMLHELKVRIIEGDIPQNKKLRAIWSFIKAVFHELNVPRPAVCFTSQKVSENTYCPRIKMLIFGENIDLKTLIIGIIVHLNHELPIPLKIYHFLKLSQKLEIKTIMEAYNGNQAAKARVYLFIQALKTFLHSYVDSAALWDLIQKRKSEILALIQAYCEKSEKNTAFIKKCLEQEASWKNPFQAMTLQEWLKK